MDVKRPQRIKPKPIDSGKGRNSQFQAGIVLQADSSFILPPVVANKLSHISSAYNLPLDVSSISLEEVNPEKIKSMRESIDLIVNNAKLLPEMLCLIHQLMKADIKLAEFHKEVAKSAINHQVKIDKITADLFLKMAGYRSAATKLEHRTNKRNELMLKRNTAYEAYYNNSVFGEQERLIDTEYAIAASNNKILSEGKAKKLEFRADRKLKAQEYINQAFSN